MGKIESSGKSYKKPVRGMVERSIDRAIDCQALRQKVQEELRLFEKKVVRYDK